MKIENVCNHLINSAFSPKFTTPKICEKQTKNGQWAGISKCSQHISRNSMKFYLSKLPSPPQKKSSNSHQPRFFNIPSTNVPHAPPVVWSPRLASNASDRRRRSFFSGGNECWNTETSKTHEKKNMYTKPLSFTIKSYFQKKIYPTKMVKLWMNQTNPPRTSGGISPPTIFFMSTLSTFNDCS